jgi:hypothetical protein
MPKPIIQVDSQKLLKKMKQYEAVVGKEVGQQVRNFSRLYALDLMRQTQPFGITNKQKQSGEGTIRTDLLRGFRALAADQLRKITDIRNAGGTYAKVKHYPDNKEFWVQVNNEFLSGDLKAKHQSMRKKGRVSGRRNDYAMTTITAFKKYESGVKKMVGFAKAGWAAAAQKMGADTKAAETGRGIPAWVKRNIAMLSPNVIDLTKDAKNPRIKFDSGVSYMSSVLSSKSINASKNITRGKMIRALSFAIRAELKKVKV